MLQPTRKTRDKAVATSGVRPGSTHDHSHARRASLVLPDPGAQDAAVGPVPARFPVRAQAARLENERGKLGNCKSGVLDTLPTLVLAEQGGKDAADAHRGTSSKNPTQIGHCLIGSFTPDAKRHTTQEGKAPQLKRF